MTTKTWYVRTDLLEANKTNIFLRDKLAAHNIAMKKFHESLNKKPVKWKEKMRSVNLLINFKS